MILLIHIGGLIGWFLICWAAVRLCLCVAQRYKWLSRKKNYSVLRKVILFVVFAAPFSSDIFFYFYQAITFPYVCDRLAGYQPKNPQKLTSIINSTEDGATYFYYLPLPGVEFVEWKKNTPKGQGTWKGFPAGLYRFAYYPQGAQECGDLVVFDTKINDRMASLQKLYQEKEYPLADRAGQCIGVEQVETFQAKYTITSSKDRHYPSGFGYDVDLRSIRLLDRRSEQVVSIFNLVNATYPAPVLNIFLGITGFIGCVNTDSTYTEFEPVRGRIMEYDKFSIERGFFILD